MLNEINLSEATAACLAARGYTTPSEFAYSIVDAAAVETLILEC